MRSPGIAIARDYSDQSTQDWGHHEFVYGLASHGGDWRREQTDWQAQRLNQPLIAFASGRHPGALGKEFSLLTVNNSRVRVLALKKAEASDEIIVRLVELDGKPQQSVHLHFPSAIAQAREVNGAEEEVGAATLANGELVTEFTPYQPRTFAIKLAAPSVSLSAIESQPVALPYDRSVATRDGHPADGSFDESGKALPAEMLDHGIVYNGIQFNLAPAGDGHPDAVTAHGQTLQLPSGGFNTIYLLAASANRDRQATFHVGEQPVDLLVQEWTGFVGQWDDRKWKTVETPATPSSAPSAKQPTTTEEFAGLTPGFIKPESVAWFASHRHASDGSNEPYAYSYLFAYRLDIPAGASTLKLPDDKDLRILSVSVAKEPGAVIPVQALEDTLRQNEQSEVSNRQE